MPPTSEQNSEKKNVGFNVDEENTETDMVVSRTEKKIVRQESTWLRALRTYKSDVAEALKKSKGSLTKIVLAERKRQDQKQQEQEKHTAPKKEIPASALPKVAGPIRPNIDGDNVPQKPKHVVADKTSITAKPKDTTLPKTHIATFVAKTSTPKEHLNENTETLQNKPFGVAHDKPFGVAHDKQRTSQKNIIVIIASVLLVIVGIGLAYGAYLVLEKRSIERPLELTQTIIVVEKQKQVPLPELSLEEARRVIRDEINGANISFNNVQGIYFVKNILVPFQEGEVKEKPIVGLLGARELFIVLESRMPATLLRSLDDTEYLFGLHSLEKNNPFLILKINSFENAFSGMLKWESFMMDDVTALFALDAGQKQFTNKTFGDVVIKNRDARVLRDSDGETVLIYSFIDRETIVLATNETTFDEIISRLKSPKRIIR